VIELVSDLGGGKTTFVRGLARGMGSADKVSSPTFTVSKVYKTGELELHHFDLYRLGQAGLIEYELQDILNDPFVVTVVEWAHVAEHVLPQERLTVDIKPTSEDQREITFHYPSSLAYLVEGL
jgi:tRNA threonylcarbamoyladenosine biosynthesis protein TsaE